MVPPGISQKGAANETPEKNKIVPDMQNPEVAGSEEWQSFHKHTQYSVARLGNYSGNTILIPLQKIDIEVNKSEYKWIFLFWSLWLIFGTCAQDWAFWVVCSATWPPRALSFLGVTVLFCSDLPHQCAAPTVSHSTNLRAEDRILPGSSVTINIGKLLWDLVLDLKKVCWLQENFECSVSNLVTAIFWL